MLQLDRNTKQIDHSQDDARFVNAWDPDFRREVQAKAAAEQAKAFGFAFLAVGRLVRRVICVMVDLWSIPALGPSDPRRS